ncbi:MAG: rod shape-determining protein RodA [Saprospiraceae bacterium]
MTVKDRGIDWMTFSLYLALVAIGSAMIYTVGYKSGYPDNFLDFLGTTAGRQLIWVGISLAGFFITYSIEAVFWRNFANIIYTASLVLLVLVLIFGKTIKGATSWFDFGGGMSFQPSEFAKFGTALALSSYLGNYSKGLKSWKHRFYALAFFMAPVALIMLQPDAGSSLVFMGFFIVLYREGFPGWVFVAGFLLGSILVAGLVNPPLAIVSIIALAGLAVYFRNMPSRHRWWALALVTLSVAAYFGFKYGYALYTSLALTALLLGFFLYHWGGRQRGMAVLVLFSFMLGSMVAFFANFAFNNVFAPHQQERILVWLKPNEADPQGAAYNLNHSKMAIGSGGLTGKGFLKGNLTQGNFVPEQITDFIFCAIGEEQGFLGVMVVITLYILLLGRIIVIGERQRSDFARLYAYGVASILFVHFFINIGMTMGLVPTIGIPLPFLSKGGSSLLIFTIMIAVLLKLDARRI